MKNNQNQIKAGDAGKLSQGIKRSLGRATEERIVKSLRFCKHRFNTLPVAISSHSFGNLPMGKG